MAETMEDILNRCRRGEAAAVAVLVDRFRRSAVDLAAALLSDEHMAEDAVQEAFLTCLRRLGDLREPAAFPGWFRQIVRTACSRITRRRREVPSDPADPSVGREPSPLDRVQHDELRQVVREALAELPRSMRDTAELFYLRELHHADVAELLGVPKGTVKRRLHDARHRLRETLLGYVGPAEQDDEAGPRLTL